MTARSFVLTVLPPIVLVGALEIGLRLMFPRLVWPTAQWSWDGGADLQADDSEWPATYPKGASGTLSHIEFDVPVQFNSEGFRGPEFTSSASQVVVFVGDSHTMGHGVALHESFADLTRQELRQADPEIEVWNLGRGGTGIVEQARLLARVLDRYPHAKIAAVVLVASVSTQAGAGNDLVDNYGLSGNLIEGEPESGTEGRVMSWRYWMRRSALIRSGEVVLSRWRREHLRLPRPEAFDPMWVEYHAGLERIYQLAAARRAKMLILHLGLHPSEPAEAIEETLGLLRAFGDPRGVPVVTGAPQLGPHPPERLWFFPIDGHINAVGHRYLFERLFPVLREELAVGGRGAGLRRDGRPEGLRYVRLAAGTSLRT